MTEAEPVAAEPVDDRAAARRGAERTRVLLAGFAGAGLAALAASREWTAATTGPNGLTAATGQTGTDLAAWGLPCALAGGAALLAMLATGNRARRALGVVAALAGAAAALAGLLHLDAGAWPWTLAAAGLVLAASGAATTARAGRWPSSADRYGPAAAGTDAIAEDPVSLWNALDSGQDPSSPNITASAQEKGRS